MLTENYKDHWVVKFIDYDFPLTEKQYRIFCHGFNADWDHRYESISVDGWHYVYRSGVWLEKIRYVKNNQFGKTYSIILRESYDEIPLSRSKHAEIKERLSEYGIKFV